MIVFNRITVTLLAVMAVLFLLTGVKLYVDSQATFESLPDYYGAFNNHFVKDAGVAFFSSGFMLAVAALNKNNRVVFTFCGSLFIVLHGLFHLSMILNGMIPADFYVVEITQMLLPAFLVLLLNFAVYKIESS